MGIADLRRRLVRLERSMKAPETLDVVLVLPANYRDDSPVCTPPGGYYRAGRIAVVASGDYCDSESGS